MRRGLGAFSRPGRNDRGEPRRGSLPDVPWDWMVLSIVGRTCPDLPRLHTQERVDALAEQVGYDPPGDWNYLPQTNQIDLLATHMIERSREGKARHAEFVLSPSQFYARTKREIPMNHEQLQAVVNHVPSSRLYRGPLAETLPNTMSVTLRNRDRSDEQARRVVRV